ncbi:MAG TPA: protein kinase, partial [Labilithrix sp.]|nr:protein kinase [Labilithrix sp.]
MSSALYQPGEVLPGTVYRVVRHLATGGMGSVYEVEDVTVEKRYVVKTLHPDLVEREDLALRMSDEAKSLARLQHPNIVDVVTAGVTADARRVPYYVMERLVGQNLRVVLEKTGRLHFSHAYRIAMDVADALDHAHENNIAHRDVKPENIFLHRNPNGATTTKLLDFGIVRLLDRKASRTHGKFIGTLRYASPEQIVGESVGPATDIYSLGVVLFEMLAGRGPFDEVGDAYAIGSAHANQPAPPLSRFVRASPEIERLVASALSKNPEERPRDCFSFASELRRLLREEDAGPRSTTAANIVSAPGNSVAPVQAETAAIQTATATSGPAESSAAPPAPSASIDAPEASPRSADVSPIAPTFAVERGASYPPPANTAPMANGTVPLRASSSSYPQRAPTPVPASEHAKARAVDRDAPTRASASPIAPRRLSPNDTQMVPEGAVGDDAPHAGGPVGSSVAPGAPAT